MSYEISVLEYGLGKLMAVGALTRDSAVRVEGIKFNPGVPKGNNVGLKGWVDCHPEFAVKGSLVRTEEYRGYNRKNSYYYTALMSESYISACYDYLESYTEEEMLKESRSMVALRGDTLGYAIENHDVREETILQELLRVALVKGSEGGRYNLSYFRANPSIRYQMYSRDHAEDFTSPLGDRRVMHNSLIPWLLNRAADAYVLYLLSREEFVTTYSLAETFTKDESSLWLMQSELPGTVQDVQERRAKVQGAYDKYMAFLSRIEASLAALNGKELYETALAQYVANPKGIVPYLCLSSDKSSAQVASYISEHYDASIPVCTSFKAGSNINLVKDATSYVTFDS